MSKLKKLLFIALLSAVGAVVGIVESMLPVMPSIPGGKIGFANIVTVTALYVSGGTAAIMVSVVRTVISSALYGGFNAFIYSFSGAVLSTLVMIAAKNIAGSKMTPIGVSVLGAASHNVAQVTVAWCIVKSNALWSYLGILLLISVFGGICSGYCSAECIKRLIRYE